MRFRSPGSVHPRPGMACKAEEAFHCSGGFKPAEPSGFHLQSGLAWGRLGRWLDGRAGSWGACSPKLHQHPSAQPNPARCRGSLAPNSEQAWPLQALETDSLSQPLPQAFCVPRGFSIGGAPPRHSGTSALCPTTSF
uniref:Uncharacterized protein n=1 Tax=Rousettus aegyptiacus TaxID=9407 RepID=A0A7J8GAV3_ROUAE|nr:hypothetical protein HJG63_011652 [Rousettus aegyptiacus]